MGTRTDNYVYWMNYHKVCAGRHAGWTAITAAYVPRPPGYWYPPGYFLAPPVFTPYSPYGPRPSHGSQQFRLFTPELVKTLGEDDKIDWPSSDVMKSLDTPGLDDIEWMIPRKKSYERSDNEVHMKVYDPRIYETLLAYIPSSKQLENLGYPTGTPEKATVFKQSTRPLPKMNGDERSCSRCAKQFSANPANYSEERCSYHWGKCMVDKKFEVTMSCCKGRPSAWGCTSGMKHVWCGWSYGVNKYSGFAKTFSQPDGRAKVLSLDCEMGYTLAGMEVIRVTVVGLGGELVYDTLVRPENTLIDYNTEYSGISEEHFRMMGSKNFHDARVDLLRLIDSSTILVGHGLENDLRVLKILHSFVVDTAIIFPHRYGMPRRRSLRDLAREVLGVKIQRGAGTTGHDSREDAGVCLDLVLRKLKDDHNLVVDI